MQIYKRLDLLTASFLINLLSLAIPLYIIHSINRYLGNGNFDTLIFLTITVIVTIYLEFLIKWVLKIKSTKQTHLKRTISRRLQH